VKISQVWDFSFSLVSSSEATESLKRFGLCGEVHCIKLKPKLVKELVRSRRCRPSLLFC